MIVFENTQVFAMVEYSNCQWKFRIREEQTVGNFFFTSHLHKVNVCFKDGSAFFHREVKIPGGCREFAMTADGDTQEVNCVWAAPFTTISSFRDR